jgi:hypothetical protein
MDNEQDDEEPLLRRLIHRGESGFHRWKVRGLDAQVLVRTEEEADGRWVIKEIQVKGDALTGDDLRKIPLRQIEAREQRVPPKPKPKRSLRRYQRPAGEPELNRPDGGDLFYQELAARYKELAEETHKPSVEIARERNVPITTARRWVQTARARGFLPPARPGAAG